VNLNLKQIFGVAVAVLGVLMISTSQLTDLFGPGVAKSITAVAGILNSILGATLAVITSQTGTVKDVLAMPGVEKIDVNGKANSTLAAIAVDPTVDKISPTPAAQAQVTAIAQGSVE
jgi:hypothetical protein